ncbi:hypothetical protein NDU88_006965, partial [Pleurodeles waltl]
AREFPPFTRMMDSFPKRHHCVYRRFRLCAEARGHLHKDALVTITLPKAHK